ncbi:MAG: hypothetical protein RI907_407 [Pseudomonadota bacterium]|jgi:TetR/AcrR family acrAB operon transcriptional repressor
MRRTKADAQLTREALLDAAEHVFGERGVSRTSLQDIARAAGMTRGAVYWHFADKAELFNAMMSRTTQPMVDALQAIDPVHETAPLEALRASTLAALHQIAHDPRTRRVFDVATHKIEYVDDLLGARTRHLTDHRACGSHIQATFARAQSLGQLPAGVAPATVASGYQALVGGLIQNWFLDPTLFDLDVVAAQAIDLFLRGLRHS